MNDDVGKAVTIICGVLLILSGVWSYSDSDGYAGIGAILVGIAVLAYIAKTGKY